MTCSSTPDYEYDVCLSFAGEQRDYVEKVAIALKDKGISVFYDNFEKWRLWGSSLFKLLYDIYSHKARYCIMFISKEYVDKLWTNVEFENILYRTAEGLFSEKYVLPIRFDNCEIPGLPRGIGYLDGNQISPKDVAGIFEQLHKANTVETVFSINTPNDMEELTNGAVEAIHTLHDQFQNIASSVDHKFECNISSNEDFPLEVEVFSSKKTVAHFATKRSEHHLYFYLSNKKPLSHYSAFADIITFDKDKRLVLRYCDVDYDTPNSGIERELHTDELLMLLWAGLCKMVERDAGLHL